MFGKFVVVLLVAFCTTQGCQARSINQEPFSVIDDILESLKQLVEKLNDAVKQVGEFIKDLQDKINEIIGQINLPGIIDTIQAKLKEILDAAKVDPVEAAKCMATAKSAIDDLNEETSAGMSKCANEVQGAKDELVALSEKLAADAKDLGHDITERVQTCVKNSNGNLIEVYECLKEQVGPVTEAAEKIVNEALEKAEKIVTEASNKLTDCMAKVMHDVQQKETAIINDFQTCIDNIQ